MRHCRLAAALFIATGLSLAAAAQGPAGYQRIYAEPTEVNLGGRPVVADIALYADMERAAGGALQLALVTDVTDFVEETQTDLKNWIAARQDRCGDRWRSGEPLIAFPPGAIRFALALELEVWNCGWNGTADPRRLTRETGKVDVTLEPYVDDGELQARVTAFSISERRGYSRYLPLESLTRLILNNEIRKLNNNPKFYRAPKPLFGEGFVYESIGAAENADGRVVITAHYKARGAAETFDRVIEKLREDGLTQ